jgi:hypothetical protein
VLWCGVVRDVVRDLRDFGFERCYLVTRATINLNITSDNIKMCAIARSCAICKKPNHAQEVLWHRELRDLRDFLSLKFRTKEKVKYKGAVSLQGKALLGGVMKTALKNAQSRKPTPVPRRQTSSPRSNGGQFKF